MEVELRAGAKLDLLSPSEHAGNLSRALPGGWEGEQEARGRGIKLINIRAQAQGAPAVNTNVAFVFPHTPNSGYLWALRLIAVSLSAGQNCRFWYGDTGSTGPTPYPLGFCAAQPVPFIQYSGVQAVLRAGEYIVITAAAASTVLGYTLTFLEAPEELVWKLA